VTGGWHPDPYGAATWRWWDGTAWSGSTAPADPDSGLTPLRATAGRSLVLPWQRGVHDADLLLDGAPVAHYRRVGGDVTAAHAAEGSWAFDPQGFTSGAVLVLTPPGGAEIGRFDWRSVGPLGGVEGLDGDLFLRAGPTVALRKTAELDGGGGGGGLFGRLAAMASTSWTFVRVDGTRLVTAAAPDGGAIHTEVHPTAADAPDTPLLTLLATYLAWMSLASAAARRNRRRHRF
jgi:hypothetical protein